ncbi:TetR family transcriptional regulator [Herbaspirillum hiltneri N3]|uniref:TetR family transcriptional regulator n=1 Tax=Herbaspirillum hiltneri N3 TaxID=1262470 RepID=A0ABN4HZ49_9BURK|nr:TetR/AcrR family transcriptional regulator [Herbaspirillum hiltneri]AKZ63969.1 TetR family transcriptional regulator [Herbaspirillum hiltneri N3]
MGRPREFDEAQVLDAAVQCFWKHGYEATSMHDLVARTGLTKASLYNAFDDKRGLYGRALEHYIAASFADRVQRFEGQLPPLEAIRAFFAEIIQHSVNDRQRRGCMLINSALETAPHDPEFRDIVNDVLSQIEGFFFRNVQAGQRDGSIQSAIPAADLGRMLLGLHIGVRVLARTKPEKALLEGMIRPALTLLEPPAAAPARRKSVPLK